MAAGADDDVLDPTGDVDVATRHVGAVPAVEPAVTEELARLRLVAEIAGGRGWPAELEPALVPFADLVADLIDDADFVTRERLPAGDDLKRMRDHLPVQAPRRRAGSVLPDPRDR